MAHNITISNRANSAFHRLLLLGLIVSCLSFQNVCAQEDFLLKTEIFDQTSDGIPVQLEYIEVPDSLSMRKLAESLDTVNYPLIVVKEVVFTPSIKLVKGLELQLLNYELKDKNWQTLDSINNTKIEKLEEIAVIERARVDVQKQANQDLNEQILNLSHQLDLSTELTERSLKGRNRKNFTIGLIGGVVGLSLGAMIAVIAQ